MGLPSSSPAWTSFGNSSGSRPGGHSPPPCLPLPAAPPSRPATPSRCGSRLRIRALPSRRRPARSGGGACHRGRGPSRHRARRGRPGLAEYDNLMAKIMVHAGDRNAAIDRLGRALVRPRSPASRRHCRSINSWQGTLRSGPPTFRRVGWRSTGDGAAERGRAASIAQLAAGIWAATAGHLGPPPRSIWSAGRQEIRRRPGPNDGAWRRAGLRPGSIGADVSDERNGPPGHPRQRPGPRG